MVIYLWVKGRTHSGTQKGKQDGIEHELKWFYTAG